MRAPSSSAVSAPETYASPVRTVVSLSMGGRLWRSRQQRGVSAGSEPRLPSVLGAVTEGERVRLRPVTAADLGAFVAFLDDADVNRWIALPDGPPRSLEAEHRWFAS